MPPYLRRGLRTSALGSRAFSTRPGGTHKLWLKGPLGQRYTTGGSETISFAVITFTRLHEKLWEWEYFNMVWYDKSWLMREGNEYHSANIRDNVFS